MTMWTDERTQSLRLKWKEGLSASQIARDLSEDGGPSLSRNAIIGRAHRLGLPRRSATVATRIFAARRRVAKGKPSVAASYREPKRFRTSAPVRLTAPVKAAPARKFTDDPGSQIAQRLLEQADSAQRRRNQMTGRM